MKQRCPRGKGWEKKGMGKWRYREGRYGRRENGTREGWKKEEMREGKRWKNGGDRRREKIGEGKKWGKGEIEEGRDSRREKGEKGRSEG